jgi:hypothetical protein
MRVHNLLVLSILCASAFLALGVTVQAQQNPPDSPSAKSVQTEGNGHVVEGTVVSTTPTTLVVRTDDNQYHLFTYAAGTVPRETVKPGARVRINGSAPDNNGAQVAEKIDVIQSGTDSANSGTGAQAAAPPAGAQAAPPPAGAQPAAPLPQVNSVTKEIESEARRWHVGGKIGFGLSPELFMFGPQAQFGPFFSQHLLFRPNLEFGFGELTDMYAVNAEAAYRLSKPIYGQWTPYLGAGPSFNFTNQSASSGDTSFSNFNYKTGFNIFVGTQKNKTFVEVRTALWAPQTPVFRMFVGYNF